MRFGKPDDSAEQKARIPKDTFFMRSLLLRLRLVGLHPTLSGVKNTLTPRFPGTSARGEGGMRAPFSWRCISMYGGAHPT